jgi:hypothetical protein
VTLHIGESCGDIGLEGKSVHDLRNSYPQFYYKLLYYKVDAVVVYQADEEAISDIFLRLQEGIPLNSAEKLNAMKGILRNKVVEIARHPFWGSLGIDNYRFAHRYLTAQVILLELNNANLSLSGLNITDVKFPKLRKSYELYKNMNPQRELDEVVNTLNFLHGSLRAYAKAIKQKGDVIPLYLLASYLLNPDNA